MIKINFKKMIISILCILILSVIMPISLYSGWLSSTVSEIDNAEIKDEKAIKATENVMGSIITIIQVVGTGVAIIMLVVLATKYMMSSAGDKADIKKHAIIYVIGAVILFAASGILGIIKNYASLNISG